MPNLTQTSANVTTTSGQQKNGIAGAAITAGNAIYVDLATSTIRPSRANAVGTALSNGIALNSAATGQPVTYVESALQGVNLGATLALGETYVVSNTAAGAIMPHSDLGTGDFTVILGVAISTSLLRLSIIASGVARA